MSPSGSSTSISDLNRIQTSWGTQERILVCMTAPRANASTMLASGRRNAGTVPRELFAVYVTQKNLTPEDRSALARNVMLAAPSRPTFVILEGQRPDPGDSRLRALNGVTQAVRWPQPPPDVAHAARRSSLDG